jgi:hypothetical protein
MPEDRPLDLKGEVDRTTSYSISKNTALLASGMLIISGLLIGLLIPELTTDEVSGKNDPYSNPLSILMSSTIDEVITDDATYTDVQIPVAYMIFFLEGSPNMTGADGKLSEYLSFLLDDPMGFTLTISSGQGWESVMVHTVTLGDISLGGQRTSDQEVIVDMNGDSEITLNFKLEVWEGPENENK